MQRSQEFLPTAQTDKTAPGRLRGDVVLKLQGVPQLFDGFPDLVEPLGQVDGAGLTDRLPHGGRPARDPGIHCPHPPAVLTRLIAETDGRLLQALREPSQTLPKLPLARPDV